MRLWNKMMQYGKKCLCGAAVLALSAAAAGCPVLAEEAQDMPEKSESVYVIADAAGDIQKVIVSDWLKNIGKEDTLSDESILSEIENLKGEETWSEEEDGKIVWDAGGNDIFYRGVTGEEPPVKVHVSYTLDGEEVTPDEIAGKSGDVTIRYSFENTAVRDVEIGGEKYEFHVPFAAVTGFLLDEDVLSDIHITNGRLFSDGDHLAAAGIAFPGLAQDLETSAYASLTGLVDADVPDYIEISAKAENFAFNTTYTLVTNELFSMSQEDAAGAVDDVFGKLESLESGLGQITQGISDINDNAGTLKKGAKELSKGLSELSGQSESLREGSRAVFDAIIGQVQENLKAAGLPVGELTQENYGEELDRLAQAAGDNEQAAAAIMAARELLEKFRTFDEGVEAYTAGVDGASAGADELKKGTKELAGGAKKLNFAATLMNGMLPDLSNVPELLKENIRLGQEYCSFTGISDNMTGKVRFIWKIDEI